MDLLFSTFSPLSAAMEKLAEKAIIKYDKPPDLLRFLPAIYHEEGERRFSPLWAILYIIQETFDSIEEKIDHVEDYFDIHTAPTRDKNGRNDFLSWLASLVAFHFDETWPETKKRYVLRIAVDLYKLRGTITYLKYMIVLYFGIEVEIREWEWPHGMQIGTSGKIGVDTVLFDRPNLNHCFTLTWVPDPSLKEDEIKKKIPRIRALIDREKPIHTRCYFRIKPEEAPPFLFGPEDGPEDVPEDDIPLFTKL